ncbi:hypothetical protein [Haloarcula pellucida]|uniref:Uncharacterized protein n=1 Tax=Haloarcula pellucida TaxID=1427151 RepID=A0A830GR75_9EURY|nr:hypothetical protein [Halomicroarcula pellucida]MBX0350490.1 hypothetical protein [Halomicroarcula pellucida]GGO03554.1 hypothetical protein GCM10009030_39350 [Halomicroarcula pellucida]
MTYHYECDGFCDHDGFRSGRPALTAEFNEDWYDSTPHGDQLRQEGYEPGDLVTLCPDCTHELLTQY